MRLKGKRILLGVCGSIAVYKSVFLLRLLQEEGAEVRVMMTPLAQKFVASLTFFTLSRHPVYTDLWSEAGDWSEHVHLGLWADALLVAPITANTIAKFAGGSCDDLLSAVYLSAKCPVIIAPAMDRDMMIHPAVTENLNRLAHRGVTILDSDSGYLASGLTGKGRLLEPETIVSELITFFQQKELSGKKILITAGATQEPIDPVRYISNHSTGKMGIALANEAFRRGAQVTLVLGTSPLNPLSGVNTIRVHSAEEMFQAVKAYQEDQELFIMTAAVSDYRPDSYSEQKIKKSVENTSMQLNLVRTPDILAHLGQTKKENQTVIGFALESENATEYALQKLKKKNADAIVMNSLADAGAGFGHDTNKATLFCADGTTQDIPLMTKNELSARLLTVIREKYLT